MSDLAKHLHLTVWQVNNGYGIMHFAVATYFAHVHEYDAAVFFMAYGVYVTANWLFMMNVAVLAVQDEAKNQRSEIEQLDAEEKQEHDAFFTTNGYPHYDDQVRIAAWGAKKGWSAQKARDFLLHCEQNEDVSKFLAEARQERLV